MKRGNTTSISRSEAAAILGRKGGTSRMIKMTPEERSKVAKLGADARWALYRTVLRTAGYKPGRRA